MYRSSSLALTSSTVSVDLTTAVLSLCEVTVPGLVGSGRLAGQVPDPPPPPPPAVAGPPMSRPATSAVDPMVAASLFMGSSSKVRIGGCLEPGIVVLMLPGPNRRKHPTLVVVPPPVRARTG